MFVTIADPFRGQPSQVVIQEFTGNPETQSEEALCTWSIAGLPQAKRITKVTWTPLNEAILTGDELGVIRLHDVQTGSVLREIREHT